MRVDLREEARAHRPELPAVSDPYMLHRAAIPTWVGRMKNEYGSRRVFRALADQLARAGLDDSECRAFADEERTHGVLCGAVVEALGGEACFDEEDDPGIPAHHDASPLEGVLRNVMSISCLSETVAVALIDAERQTMAEGPLRDLLSRILADEIGHARFGWKLFAKELPRLDPAARERLTRYLRVALEHLVRHELAHLVPGPLVSEDGALLGLCDGNEARRLFYATVEEVILPGLEALGIGYGTTQLAPIVAGLPPNSATVTLLSASATHFDAAGARS
jgi:hypothetical protein